MNERDLVNEVRQALDDSLDQVDQSTRSRLLAARRAALHPAGVKAGEVGILILARHHPWIVMLLLACGLLMVAWFGLRVPPAASVGEEVDIMLLTDDIPPQAYADWRLVHREDMGPQCRAVN